MLEFYTQIIDAATFMSLPHFEGGKVGSSFVFMEQAQNERPRMSRNRVLRWPRFHPWFD
jgi:hypothetical protein